MVSVCVEHQTAVSGRALLNSSLSACSDKRMSARNTINDAINDVRQQINNKLMASAQSHFNSAMKNNVMTITAANNTLNAAKMIEV